MDILRISRFAVVLALVSLSCGGDDDASTGGDGSVMCNPVSACGGSLVGDWKVSGVCVDQAMLSAQAKQICDDATLMLGSPKVTGSISYKADGTFTQGASTADGTVDFMLGASCLKQGMVTFTCDQIQTELNKDPMNGAMTSCVSSNGGCKCSAMAHATSMANGTYTVSGNTVTLTSSTDSTTEVQDYCVVGSKLYLLPSADSALPAQLQFARQ